MTVLDRPCLFSEDKKPGRGPVLQRILRNQLLGQIKIEICYIHGYCLLSVFSCFHLSGSENNGGSEMHLPVRLNHYKNNGSKKSKKRQITTCKIK